MQILGNSDLKVSRQGLGCMSMSEFYGTPISEKKAIDLILKAYEIGINFFDTADVYGYGKNEILLGNAIRRIIENGVHRSKIIIATKCGIIRDEHDVTKRGVDNSYEYVKESCVRSLTRLGGAVGYIDLFYLHRISLDGKQIDAAMKAMSELLDEGKIRAVGLSEANQENINSANKALLKHTNGKHQLTAVQSEYSLMTRVVEVNGVLKTCRELGVTFIAYSPLSRALLTGEIENTEQLESDDFRRNLPRFQIENLVYNNAIIEQIKSLAEKKGCTTSQVALAWVMHQPNVIPIPGTTKEAHLLTNSHAESVELTNEELFLLNKLPEAKGYRYVEAAMKAYGFDDELKNMKK